MEKDRESEKTGKITKMESTELDFDMDMNFSFDLKMQEAINASLALLPSTSKTPPPLSFTYQDDQVSLEMARIKQGKIDREIAEALMDMQDDQVSMEMARIEQEKMDREIAEALMDMQDDRKRPIHDQDDEVVARLEQENIDKEIAETLMREMQNGLDQRIHDQDDEAESNMGEMQDAFTHRKIHDHDDEVDSKMKAKQDGLNRRIHDQDDEVVARLEQKIMEKDLAKAKKGDMQGELKRRIDDQDDEVAQKQARIEQEKMDWKIAKAEMKAMHINRRIHDQFVAYEMSKIPDKEWAQAGNIFYNPYDEGTSSAAEAYRLYCKGLVREEKVGGVNRTLAGIGIAICDTNDVLLFEIRKPLVSGELSSDFAEVNAVIEGLHAVIALGIKRLNILCDNPLLHRYVIGVSKPRKGNMTTLVEQISNLKKKLSSCAFSLVLQKNIKFVFELANKAIISQLAWPTEIGGEDLKQTCLICLEDVDASKMFSIDGCQHSFCSLCIKPYAEVKLLQGKLPKCPYEGCTVEMKLETCDKLFEPELFDLMSQCVKEASIPAIEKVYCPHPKCSVLMTKTQAKAYMDNDGASKCLKCDGLFCRKCKVPWHKNMNCKDYKRSNPFPCKEDAKLNSLATKKLWRQCVMCKSMVELAHGCYHITCRCGYEFCYICGALWKNKRPICKCPIWDERNLVNQR